LLLSLVMAGPNSGMTSSCRTLPGRCWRGRSWLKGQPARFGCTRTFAPNRSVTAGVLFRRGDRAAAYRDLRCYVDELLDTDNMQGTAPAAIEFANMMAAVGRYGDSTRILGFLDTTGMFDNPAWATQVADTRAAPAANVEPADHEPRIDDHRQALLYMRQVLDRLLINV